MTSKPWKNIVNNIIDDNSHKKRKLSLSEIQRRAKMNYKKMIENETSIPSQKRKYNSKTRTSSKNKKKKGGDVCVNLALAASGESGVPIPPPTDKEECEVKEEVADCIEFAENSPWPDNTEVYKDIYQDEYPFLTDDF